MLRGRQGMGWSTGGGAGWGNPKISLGFGVWDCMHLAWGPDCVLGAWGPLASRWGSGRGDAWVSFGAEMWGPHASHLGSGFGDPHITLGVRTWGLPAPCSGWGRGTLAWCSGAGHGDPCIMLGVRMPGPLNGGRDMGTFALGSGSGCGDPCMALGVTGGPLHGGCDMGTLAGCSGWGRGDLDAGTLASGLEDHTLLLGLVWRDPGFGASTWGHLHWGQDLGTTVRGPQHLPGAQRAGNGGRWGQVVSVPFLLAGTVTRGQVRAPRHPGWLRIIRMQHRSRLTPS